MGEKHNKKLWTQQEDQVLIQIVKTLKTDKWNQISKQFQYLFIFKYGFPSNRSGKQCRQRWYNKLNPCLENTLQQWTKEQLIALVDSYQQIGPKWAKIIVKLSQKGFHRRSDNGIKNHFHMELKKAIRNLNIFVQQFNKKGKQKHIFLEKPKKKYLYPKTYSIQRMARMKIGFEIPKNEQKKEEFGKKQSSFQIESQSHQKKFEQKEQNQSKILERDPMPIIQSQAKNLEERCQSTANYHQMLRSLNSQQTGTKYETPLRKIDKAAVNRLLLCLHENNFDNETLQSQSYLSFENGRSLFLTYLKTPEKFSDDQKNLLIKKINAHSKFCKVLNKKQVAKRVKKKAEFSRSIIYKITKKLFEKLTNLYPDDVKIFNANKAKITPRLYFLSEKIYHQNQNFQEDANNEYVLKKEEQQKILSIILEEVKSLKQNKRENQSKKKSITPESMQAQPSRNLENQHELSQKIKNCQRNASNKRFTQINQRFKNRLQQNLVKLKPIKKLPKIKRQSKPFKNSSLQIKFEEFGENIISQSQSPKKKAKKLFQNRNLAHSKLNQRQTIKQIDTLRIKLENQNNQDFQSLYFQQNCFDNAENSKKKKKNIQNQSKLDPQDRKSKQKNIIEQIQESNEDCKKKNEGQNQTSSKEQILDNIKQKFFNENDSQCNEFKAVKYFGSELLSKIPLKKNSIDQIIDKQNSEYSLGSKKSLRPNRLIVCQSHRMQDSLDKLNEANFSEVFNNSNPKDYDLEIELPEKLRNSIEFCLANQNLLRQKIYNLKESDSPLRLSQSNFLGYDKNGNRNSSIINGSQNLFQALSNSQELIGLNNSIFNKAGSTNFNTFSKKRSILQNSGNLVMSCENANQFTKVAEMNSCFKNQHQNGFINNSFLKNIRNIAENQTNQWKETKVYNFEEALLQNTHRQAVPTPAVPQNNPEEGFLPFKCADEQPIDFEIPQKLIQTAKNSDFPKRNFNDYSLKYYHLNSIDHSKALEFDINFGLNSARISEVDIFRSEDRNQLKKSRSKEFDKQNLFKSQRIQSINENCFFMNKSRQLSNSCIYSSHEEMSLFGSMNQEKQNSLKQQQNPTKQPFI